MPICCCCPEVCPGTATLDKHEGLRKLLLDFAAKGKPIAAICAAPMVLGKLGLLKGRKATCYPSFEQYLEGAECVSEPVVGDGKYHHRYGTGRCYGVCIDHRRSVGRQRKSRRTGRSNVCKTLMSMNYSVIIVAGGKGLRMGSDLPKQFLPIGGANLY